MTTNTDLSRVLLAIKHHAEACDRLRKEHEFVINAAFKVNDRIADYLMEVYIENERLYENVGDIVTIRRNDG